MARKLEIAFNEYVAGIFTLASELGGTDVMSDVGSFDGTYDDVTLDVSGDIVVTGGLDALARTLQPGSLTANLSRVDDPGYWNPNNPDSPPNSVFPGFEDGRPVRCTDTLDDGTEYGVFYGFIVRAPWKASTLICQLYCEDLLGRAKKAFPEIDSTGPTTTGAAVGLVLDAMGWTWADFRSIAEGDPLDDFSADGSLSAFDIFQALVTAERGAIFVRGDGVFVYESRGMVQTRLSVATLSTGVQLEDLDSSVDGDQRYTRVTVTKTDPTGDTDGTTWTDIDTAAESRYGRNDAPAIQSPYVPGDGGQLLADDIVYEGVTGKPPVTATATATPGDDDARAILLGAPLQSLFTIDDPLGGTTGDYIVQGFTQTLSDDDKHTAEYTLTKRAARSFALDSELGGTDVFRY